MPILKKVFTMLANILGNVMFYILCDLLMGMRFRSKHHLCSQQSPAHNLKVTHAWGVVDFTSVFTWNGFYTIPEQQMLYLISCYLNSWLDCSHEQTPMTEMRYDFFCPIAYIVAPNTCGIGILSILPARARDSIGANASVRWIETGRNKGQALR